MFRKLRVSLFLFALTMSVSLAQQINVSGKVVYKDKPLEGVNVILKDKNSYSLTDKDGVYSIKVDKGDIIVFSYLGMQTQEIEVLGNLGSKTYQINVVLKLEADLLQDMVVVAYGEESAKTTTGSIASVSDKDLKDSPVGDVYRSIQGKLPGVYINSSSGALGPTGSGVTIRVRGTGSLSASNSPLYVVDGKVVTSDFLPDQNDIESLTVLKDAASASMYGSRASNGVIVIKTKRGKSEPKFSFSYSKVIADFDYKKYKLIGAADFYKKTWEGIKNAALEDGKTEQEAIAKANQDVKRRAMFNPFSIDDPIDDDGNIKSSANLVYDTDWRGAMVKQGDVDRINFNVMGGLNNIDYFISINRTQGEGVMIANYADSKSGRANINAKINDRLNISAKAFIEKIKYNIPSTGFSEFSILGNLHGLSGVVPIYERDQNNQIKLTNGKRTYNYRNGVANDFNPLAQVEDPEEIKLDKTDFSIDIDFKILDGLEYKLIASNQNYSNNYFYFLNADHGNGTAKGGISYKSSREIEIISVTNLLDYKLNYDLNDFNFLIGYEAYIYENKFISASSQGYPLGKRYIELSSGQSANGTPSSSTTEYTIASIISRLKYNFDNKYFATFSLRQDGSSRFGPNKRYGTFYSVGLSWILSEEYPIKNVLEEANINFLKLSTSYGSTGNAEINDYLYYSLYSLGRNYNDKTGLFQTQLENLDLSWESNTNFNFSFGIELFESRIKFDFQYYIKNHDNLLSDKPLPISSGYESITTNIGAIKNTGVEIQLSTINLETHDFLWSTDFNISFNDNKIKKLSQDEVISGNKRWVVGKSTNNLYMRRWAGVDKSNGKPQWWDYGQKQKDGSFKTDNTFNEKDEDGRLRKRVYSYNDADKVDVGKTDPDFTGQLLNTFEYDNIKFSFNFYFDVGGKFYDSQRIQNMHDGRLAAKQLHIDALNSWKKPGDITNVPKYIVNRSDKSDSQSTRFLYNSSVYKLNNVTLGYEFPKNIIKDIMVDKLYIYFSGDNLLTFTEYDGYDTQVGLGGGGNNNQIPNLTTYVLGINLDF